MIYRAIEPGDCAALVALHGRAFSDGEIESSIFVSSRVENYLRQLAAFPANQRENFLWGAWEDAALVGYAFGRALETSWHLNYLAVAPEFRRHGIARALWDLWENAGRARGYRAFTLDVEAENQRARDWYERMEWQIAHNAWLYRRELTNSSLTTNESALRILDWENAEVWQESYGFSQFKIAFGEKQLSVGRLGQMYFRASEPLPRDVENWLHQLDANRKLLLVLPEPMPEALPEPSAWKILLRMKRA